jgi:hypothetical protein
MSDRANRSGRSDIGFDGPCFSGLSLGLIRSHLWKVEL